MQVDPNVTTGDYLQGFFLGTRQALYENDRESVTLTVRKVSPFAIGVLIALFERAVGFYASLININAYHQPGVESGKKAAAAVIDLQLKIISFLEKNKGVKKTVSAIAAGISSPQSSESVFKICEHLSSNAERGVRKTAGISPFESGYTFE